jgi:hypothetical protein
LLVVSGLSGRMPLLRRAEHALRSKPSRQSASALRLTSSGLSCLVGRLCLLVASSQRVVLSPASQHDSRSSVKAVALLRCFLPPRGGVRRTHLGSMSSSAQASMDCVSFTCAMALVKACAQRCRAFLGTCFRVGTFVDMMVSSVGRGLLMSASSSSSLKASTVER